MGRFRIFIPATQICKSLFQSDLHFSLTQGFRDCDRSARVSFGRLYNYPQAIHPVLDSETCNNWRLIRENLHKWSINDRPAFPGANTFFLNKPRPGLFLLQIRYRANGSVSITWIWSHFRARATFET